MNELESEGVPIKDILPLTASYPYLGVIDEKDLIKRYLPLVRSIVDRIKLSVPAHIDADDLYSVGITGLIAAVRKFDPEQGATFAGYAAMRIRGAILDELRRSEWCPRPRLARVHSPMIEPVVKPDPKSNDSGSVSLHDLLRDDQSTAESSLEKAELLQLLTQRIAELPDVPKKILAMYYFENMTLANIASIFGLTESRICQIHAQTILSLRDHLQSVRESKR